MALKDTINTMKKMVTDLARNLEKAVSGNRAAAQRVRTGTVKFAKTSKVFRKESMMMEKKGGVKKTKKRPPQAKKATAKLPSKKRK